MSGRFGLVQVGYNFEAELGYSKRKPVPAVFQIYGLVDRELKVGGIDSNTTESFTSRSMETRPARRCELFRRLVVVRGAFFFFFVFMSQNAVGISEAPAAPVFVFPIGIP